jgi:membrane fusion protein, multidrug efflux system
MEETEKPNPPNAEPNKKRKKLLWGMTFLFTFLGICAFLFWLIWGRFYEYTNDAYVSGNLVFVTPQVSGIVTSIYIDDSQRVDQGHLLIELDKTMFQIALEKSKAHLADEIRSVAQLFQQTKQALAMVEVAKAQLKTAAQDFERRTFLIDSGGVSAENFDHAQNKLRAAIFTLAAAEANHSSLLVQVDKTSIERHPRVKKAEQQLKDAWIQLKRTTLRAPTHGLIAERTVQVGQRVQPGEPLFSIVPLDQIWVDANFKEVQIGKMQIGQPVKLVSDMYGGSVEYHGYVQGIGGGTGSVFSVLPPQNATGNWIKIVQRLPIRISLNPEEITKNPLRLGLSMDVTVDIHNIGETSIPNVTQTKAIYQTDIFSHEEEGVEEVIEGIFKENLPPLETTEDEINK